MNMKYLCLLVVSLFGICQGHSGSSQICTQVCHELDTAQALKALSDKVDEMATQLEQNTNAIQEMEKDLRVRCMVRYRGKCFWTIMRTDMTLEQATNACAAENGAKLANIYDHAHYRLLMDYMRPRIPDDDYRDYVWIGMKYSDDNVVTYDDGTRAPYVQWHSGYPDSRANFNEMCFLVNQDASSAQQGMYNQPTETTKKGVLCEL